MIIEITTYNTAAGVTHEELMQASKDFTKIIAPDAKA